MRPEAESGGRIFGARALGGAGQSTGQRSREVCSPPLRQGARFESVGISLRQDGLRNHFDGNAGDSDCWLPAVPLRSLTITRISPLQTGAFRLDGGGMFGLIPKTMWSQWFTPDEQNRIPLTTRSLLVDTSDGLVLVEAGYGDKWNEKERAMYEFAPRTVVDALREHGATPDAIAHVVLTHLHFDHAAGLTRKVGAELVSTFPNARIHVQRQEWQDALANKSTMTKTYFRSHLDPVATQMELHDGECEPLEGFKLLPSIGHTWGHQSVLIQGQDKTVLFLGDACPTMHHAHPAASLGYDMLAYESMLTKARLLKRAAQERWIIALDHDPTHAYASAVEVDGRMMLHPI